MKSRQLSISSVIQERIDQVPKLVWTPSDKDEGARLAGGLRAGLSAIPIWMQEVLRKPLDAAGEVANP